MLTTGVRLRRNPEAQRALVPQLEAEGVSALGFGVGLGFKRVPPALVEVAREREIPVFAVPYETPFREIIHFVDSSLTSGEEQVFRRLTALQRYLVDALRTAQPEQAMVDRLAGFLEASVVLAAADGSPRSSPGTRPSPSCWRRSAASRRVCSSSSGTVGTRSRRRSPPAPTGDALARAGQPAARLHPQAREAGRGGDGPAARRAGPAQRRGARSGAGREGGAARGGARALRGARPAAPGGARGGVRPRLLPARAARRDRAPPAPRQRRRRRHRRRPAQLVGHLEHAGIPHLAHQRDGSLTALVQGDEQAVQAVLAAASDAFPDIVIGVGRAVTAIVDAHHSLRDAKRRRPRRPRSGPAHHALRGLRPRHVPGQRDRARAAGAQGGRDPCRRCGPTRRCTRPSARTSPTISTSARPRQPCTCTATRCATGSRGRRRCSGSSLKQPSTIAAVYLALVAEAGDQSRAASLDRSRLPGRAGGP